MIREITKDEIAECVKVIKASFQTVAKEFNITLENAPRYVAFSTTEERLENQLVNEHRAMFAYFDNDRIVGYYSLSALENKVCELNNLCVLPEYRHTGIGVKLLQDSFEKAKKLDNEKMICSIVEENKVLRKWYESNGFIHYDTRKFDFFPFTCGYLYKEL